MMVIYPGLQALVEKLSRQGAADMTIYDAELARIAGSAMPPATAEIVAGYDRLAPVYDERYSTSECAAENSYIADLLLGTGPRLPVMDLGCGTGLLVDLIGDRVPPDCYLGVDPSAGMLSRFAEKHPDYTRGHFPDTAEFTVRALRQHPHYFQFGTIAALFGSASYIDPLTLRALPELLAPGGLLLLMAYGRGYHPDYEELDEHRLRLVRQALVDLQDAFFDMAYTYPWHNFLIFEGRR